MILVLQIAMFIGGLIALCNGKLQLSKKRTAIGASARVAGAIIMMPIVISFIVGFLLGALGVLPPNFLEMTGWTVFFTIFELAVILLCVLAAIFVAYQFSTDRDSFEDEDSWQDEDSWDDPRSPAHAAPQLAPTTQYDPSSSPIPSTSGHTGPPPLLEQDAPPRREIPESYKSRKSAASSFFMGLIMGGVYLFIALILTVWIVHVLYPPSPGTDTSETKDRRVVIVNNGPKIVAPVPKAPPKPKQVQPQPIKKKQPQPIKKKQPQPKIKADPMSEPFTAYSSVIVDSPSEAGNVVNASYSRDGKWFVIGTTDGRAVWYDGQTHELLKMTDPWKSKLNNLRCAVSPSGDRVAFIASGSAFILSRSDKEPTVQKLSQIKQPQDIDFSPNGLFVVMGSRDTTEIRDGRSLKLVSEISELKDKTISVSYAPNGSMLAVGGDDSVTLSSPHGENPIARILTLRGSVFCKLVFSPDASQLVAAKDNCIYSWNLNPLPRDVVLESRTRILWFPESVWKVAFTNDGSTLITVSNTAINLWDTKTAKKKGYVDLSDYNFRGELGGVHLAIRPTDNRIVLSSGNRILICDIKSLQHLKPITPKVEHFVPPPLLNPGPAAKGEPIPAPVVLPDLRLLK